jgi:hypothetical protein
MRRYLNQLAVVVVTLPIAIAALRAAAGGWTPTGDDAYFTVRSRDVLTRNHPLLGAWSSGSSGLKTPINNLGPMQLDLLFPFTRVAPLGGTAIGTAVINIAAVVTVAWLISRRAGPRAMAAAMVAVGLLTWTMGSEMLITPRQHQAMILPYLCLLVATWVAASGDRWALVGFVAAGSLVAQTHLSYPVLVAALAATVVIGQVLATRAGEATGGRRAYGVSGALFVVLWAQTLLDQFWGRGNLGHVLFGSGGTDRAGWETGSRIVAGVLVSVDWLVRPGYRQFDSDVPHGTTLQLIVLALVVAGLAVVAARTVRGGGWQRAVPAVVVVVAVVAGTVDAALLPRSEFGLVIGNYRWLWATGAFTLVLVLVWLADRLRSLELGERPRLALTSAVAVACLVPAIANLPRSVQHSGAERYKAEQRAVAELRSQLDASFDLAPPDGAVLVDDSGMYFGHGFTYPTLLMMQEHEIPFRFDDDRQERRFGGRRASDGTERQVLRLVAGDLAREALGDEHLLAYVDASPPVAVVLDDVSPGS